MKVEAIIVYTHRGCLGGDAALQYLERNQIPHRLRDVAADDRALAELRRLGGMGTPLLVIGPHVMHGFDPDELQRLIKLAGRSGERG